MRLQYQTKFGSKGNCLATCVACIFDLDVHDVPTFMGGGWWSKFYQWCKSLGYIPIQLYGSSKKALDFLDEEQYHIVVTDWGVCDHATIYRGMTEFWDPYPYAKPKDTSKVRPIQYTIVFTAIAPRVLST